MLGHTPGGGELNLLLIGLLWAGVLVPTVLRARAADRADFAGHFEDIRTGLMHASTGVGHRRVATRSERQQRVLWVLVTGMLATLTVAALASSRGALVLHLLLGDVCLIYLAVDQYIRIYRPDWPR